MVTKGYAGKWVLGMLRCGVLIGMFTIGLHAQGLNGTIRGVTSDQSGALISGADVMVTNTETNLQRTAVTDEAGSYVIQNLPPGAYQIQVSLVGFQNAKQSLILALGQEIVMHVSLKVAGVAEAVEVTTETLSVQVNSAEISGSVSPGQVRDLPLNQRDFRDLTTLVPGVAPMPASNTQAGGSASTRKLRISVAGGRVSATSYYLDGIYINQRDGMAPEGITGSLLGIDAIREFSVLTNSYSARFGRGGSGVVNIVSRGGTNGFHGTVYEYLRNDLFDASNFFALQKPPLRKNQFGFTFGGPIRKDKTFFFLSWERLLERDGRTIVTRVPDVNARNGLLPNGTGGLVQVPNLIGAQVSGAVLNLYPLPNGRNFSDGTAENIAAFSSKTRDDAANLRIDEALSSSHNFFARYTFNDGMRVEPASLPVFTTLPRLRDQWITLQEDWVVSKKLVNSVRVGFTRLTTSSIGGGVSADPILTIPGRWNPPTVTISPLTIFTPPGITPATPTVNSSYQFGDDVLYNTGRHTLEFGARVEKYKTVNRFIFSKDGTAGAGSGTWTFNTLKDFFGNNSFLLRDNVGIRGNAYTIDQTSIGAYVQDEYRMLNNLTLSIGLRFEHSTSPRRTPGPYKMINVFSDLGNSPVEQLYTTNPVLEPRIGLAWQIRDNGRLVVRSGFGMFYDQLSQGFYSNGMGINFPYSVNTTSRGVPFPNPYPTGVFPPANISTTFAYLDHQNVPATAQYNLSVTHLAPKHIEVTAAYVGSQSSHLTQGKNVNTYPTSIVNGRRFFDKTGPTANPTYTSDIFLRTTDGKAYYHALQLSARQSAGGLDWQTSYTFSKCIDTSSTDNTGDFGGLRDQFVYDAFDVRNNRGLCAQDVRARFVVNLTYEPRFRTLQSWAGALLNGWKASSIAQLQSGSPFTLKVTFPRSNSNFGSVNSISERPDIAPGLSNIILGGPDRYFDPTVYRLQPEGFLGNLGRDTLIGPGFANVDLSLTRMFPLHVEQMNLQFRAEAFNILNRPNFGLPNWQIFTNTSGIANPAAGRITDTSNPARQFQFSLKLVF